MVDRGICGFKCFLIHSGVEEFPSVHYAEVEEALTQLAGTNSVLLVGMTVMMMISEERRTRK